MPILHMETEAVRSVAQQLQGTADILAQRAEELRLSLYTLQNVWHGGTSQEIFFNDLSQLLYQLNRLAEDGNTLYYRVQQEVTEWINVDNFGVTQISSHYLPSIAATGQLQFSAANISYTHIQEGLASLSEQFEWAKLGQSLYGLAGLRFVLGSSYDGQVLVYGSHLSKKLAGVNTHLTHIQDTNMAAHVYNKAGQVTGTDAVLALLKVIPQWMANYSEYGDDVTKLTTANLVDSLAITGVGLGAAYVGGAAGAKAGGAIGLLVGGPVGAAAGAVIGGVAGKFISGYMASEFVSKPFLESDLRQDIVSEGAELIQETGISIESTFSNAAAAIQNVSVPQFQFSW